MSFRKWKTQKFLNAFRNIFLFIFFINNKEKLKTNSKILFFIFDEK
jgi:hypothetical protein